MGLPVEAQPAGDPWRSCRRWSGDASRPPVVAAAVMTVRAGQREPEGRALLACADARPRVDRRRRVASCVRSRADHLIDVAEIDQPPAMDASESRSRPLLLERGERDTRQEATRGGDEAGVVAVRLHVAHPRSPEEARSSRRRRRRSSRQRQHLAPSHSILSASPLTGGDAGPFSAWPSAPGSRPLMRVTASLTRSGLIGLRR